MGKLEEVGKKVLETTKNILDYHLNGNHEGVVFNDYAILRKPIGIASKSYGFMEATLHRNIGSHQFEFDGYATLLGMNANPYLNSEVSPWFMLDKDKQKYDNYLNYVNKTYFHGTMLPPNFQRMVDKMKLFDYTELIGENSYVGAIHHYDIDNILGARLLIPNGATNPNGYNDTKLGIINNFYLSSMLYASYEEMNSRLTSSYEQPSSGDEEYVNGNSYSVTQGAYSEFGFKGTYGLNDNTYWSRTSTVIPQQNILPDKIISSLEYQGLSRFLGSTSEALYKASGGKNREFIMKSIYGVDLMLETPFLGNGAIDYNIIKKRSQKKYYTAIEDKDSVSNDYLSQITNHSIGYEVVSRDTVEHYARFHFTNPGNDNYKTFGTFLAYLEAEGNNSPVSFNNELGNAGIAYGRYETYNNLLNGKDIISYTNEQFKKNQYKTIIGRFHTDKDEYDKLSSAVSQYGLSRGRNLLKRHHKNQNTNGFEDPYCRVWTYHKQYSTYSNLIRPFINNGKDNRMADELDDKLEKSYQVNRKHLRENSVINKTNRLLNIAPTTSGDPIYRCMFSIENLAWKGSDLFENTKYKKGPQKGRIMWFPPYGLTFNENVNTNWSATQFIGRGEKIYSYVDTERSGNLSFILLIDHPSIINSVSKATETQGGVDDVESTEQALLRFFAGCEVLGDSVNKQQNGEDKHAQSAATTTNIVESIQDLSIKFNIYFPNNYSGKDDEPKTMVQYLINGLGPNLYESNMQYTVDGEHIGGYEIQNNKGISYITEWKNGVPSNPLFYAKGEGKEYAINALLCDNKNGGENNWGYRVDEDKENEILKNINNYLDTVSFGLNTVCVEGSEVLCNFVDFATYMGHSEMGDKKVVSTLNSVLNTHKIKTIKLCGYSTQSGEHSANVILAKERAKSVKKWLCTNIFLDLVNDIQITTQDNISVPIDDINSKESKENRKVSVEIILQSEDISNNTPDQASMGNMTPLLENHYTQEEGGIDTRQTQTKTSTESDIVEIKNEYNEFDFFQEISVNNPFLRNKIVDKIKYFDPAFHSITPEGFNSRLTFLHQCTRQGATNSASESNGNNVRNLSFGAPPICVLRIGDFFNTKIIINSLNITYDETCWDMNDEGIGVMPMMAKVDISFHFLGGSDLSGPIARLQNAVSFNYYANTSVYDTVADINKDKINNSKDNDSTK